MAAKKLVNLYDVMDYCRISNTDSRKSGILDRLIDNCSSQIVTALSRDIYLQTYTSEYYNIDRDTSSIFLKQYPVSSTPAVTVTENGTALVEGTSFKLDYARGELFRTSGITELLFASGIQVLAVTYRAGYSMADIPEALKQACTELAYFKLKNRDGGALEEITFEGSRGGTGTKRAKMKKGLPENVYYMIEDHMDSRVKIS